MKKELTPQQEVKKDIKKFKALEVLAESEGGEILLASLATSVESSMEDLASSYKTATHAELIASCAKLSEQMLMWKVITNANKNKKFALAELKRLKEEEYDE